MFAPAIKICGIATPDALDAALAARAGYVGLVFFPKSPRNVTLAAAAALGARAAGRAQRVGLIVDADDAMIAAAIAAAGLDALQLHGDESPARAAELRARHGLPVWKALAVAGASDVARAADYAGAADLVLPSKLTNMLASGRPVVATVAPGTGLAAEVEGCGLVSAPGDAVALAGAVTALLDDPDLAARCGVAARERALDRWSQQAIIDRLAERLRGLAG